MTSDRKHFLEFTDSAMLRIGVGVAMSRSNNFRVEISGIELPADLVQRIEAAIRKSVLTELATVNLQGKAVDLLAQPLVMRSRGFDPVGGSSTPGIDVRLEEE
ncbi:hypothetical protein [Streptomyces sp. R17]|uniref:Uncharacterized protein n=1 Tax=Streptomyces sp. R17 TaxID=3238626 RepID=A0AB39P051_9ACTN